MERDLNEDVFIAVFVVPVYYAALLHFSPEQTIPTFGFSSELRFSFSF